MNADIKGMYLDIVNLFNIYTGMVNVIVSGISEQLKFSWTEHLLCTFPVICTQHWHAIENWVHLEISVRFIYASIICL